MKSAMPTPPPPDETTGLPWIRSWRVIYVLVVGSFILWVVLLLLMEKAFP